MSFDQIETHLRNQKTDEKAPIHWVEVPGCSRVTHVSEVPELWEAQKERDFRLTETAIRSNRVIALLTVAAFVTLLTLGAPPQAPIVLLVFGIQSAETWFEAAYARRRLRLNASSYFQQCAREVRYSFWVLSIRDSALWRTWILSGTWVVLFGIQSVVGLDSSIARAGLVKPKIWRGEVWRLLTGPMLHGNVWHIWMNVTSGIMLALLIERTAHRHVLLPLWLFGTLGGSLCSLTFSPEGTSVGASGGLMGFVGFLAVLGWKRKHLLPPRFAANILRSVGFMAVFGLLAWSVIDNAAHAGGALTGALIGYRLCCYEEGGLPLSDTGWRTVLGWCGVSAFGALFGFTVWRLLMSD
ncbi:MAG: rhomboid family intramembrane serine protease [Verrucomicrobia bacterium]|nr:rhomboid family intramembrane serine protease [Verrucomicrobiota bacterium]